MNPPRHILVSRTDKIGDLLCTLPVFGTLRKAFPQARLTALVSPYAQEIVRDHPWVDAVEPIAKGEGPFPLAERFRRLRADTFLGVYPRPSLAAAAWLAHIPLRVGTAYRWYSPFFNRKVWVHRSASDRHEVEYNLDLVGLLGVTLRLPRIELPLTDKDRGFAADLLKEKGVPYGTHYTAVHPGHRGSALNWSLERYAELAGKLLQKGHVVVLTAGPEETGIIARVTTHLKVLGVQTKPVLLIGECNLKQLAAVYEGADCFLSGSTGTMHLAAAVGTPTVSLFGTIPQTTPVRWGPWGNEATVLMPQGLQCADCRLGHCRRHDPMDGIPVEEVLRAVEKYIERAKVR
jgi:ADP-heptose:LPS heptosyltransferase